LCPYCSDVSAMRADSIDALNIVWCVHCTIRGAHVYPRKHAAQLQLRPNVHVGRKRFATDIVAAAVDSGVRWGWVAGCGAVDCMSCRCACHARLTRLGEWSLRPS
jgi:hypothetical protein